MLRTYFSTQRLTPGVYCFWPHSTRILGAVFCQQHINSYRVINTPTDNTSEEPLAQGKKLQKEPPESPRIPILGGSKNQIDFGCACLVYTVQNAYFA
jgi:hypothetical protein